MEWLDRSEYTIGGFWYEFLNSSDKSYSICTFTNKLLDIFFYSLQSFPPSWHFIVFFSKSLQTSNKCYFNLNVLGSPQGSLLFGIIPFFPLHSSRALDLPKSFATSLRTVSGLWECRWVIPYLALSPELSYQPPQPMRHRNP